MELLNFNSVFPYVQSMYGIDPDENDFEDVAITAWSQINTKHTRLYRFIGNVENGELVLPCNATALIESVHIPLPDAKVFDTKYSVPSLDNVFTEYYSDAWDVFKHPFDQHGKLIKYDEGNGTLYFDRDYRNVMVVYHGILADNESGLPLITEKEKQAIACFVAYNALLKEAIKKRDQGAMNMAQALKADWMRLCNAARIPEHLSQNDMDMILDVRSNWARKKYGISYRPIK